MKGWATMVPTQKQCLAGPEPETLLTEGTERLVEALPSKIHLPYNKQISLCNSQKHPSTVLEILTLGITTTTEKN